MVIEVKLSFDSHRTLKHSNGIKSEWIFAWYWCASEQFGLLICYVFKVQNSFVSISTLKTHIALNQNELLPGLPNIWHHGKNIVRSQRTAQSTSHPLMRCQASGSWQTLDILYWKKFSCEQCGMAFTPISFSPAWKKWAPALPTLFEIKFG